ncbi:hypothetical protein TSUD_275950 [Trifolium subterraneum]|uniref:Uncharacterized protein n=1 Tax=Trifolium subterraneum TaxID=3900 RepID=A0A2Z6M9S2_TRISU|nr:hypothetical protein TSUD_275950 [Trifolium subterraneum]
MVILLLPSQIARIVETPLSFVIRLLPTMIPMNLSSPFVEQMRITLLHILSNDNDCYKEKQYAVALQIQQSIANPGRAPVGACD